MIPGRPAAFVATHATEGGDNDNFDNNDDDFSFLSDIRDINNNNDFETANKHDSQFDRRSSTHITSSSAKKNLTPPPPPPHTNSKAEVAFRLHGSPERPSTVANQTQQQQHKVKFEPNHQTSSRSKSQLTISSTASESSASISNSSIQRGSLRLKPTAPLSHPEEDDETAASSPNSSSSSSSFGSIGDNIIAGRSLKLPLSSSLSGRSMSMPASSMRQRRMSFAEGQRHQEVVESSSSHSNVFSASQSSRQRRLSCFEQSSRPQLGRSHSLLASSSRHDNNNNNNNNNLRSVSDSSEISSPRSSSLGVPGSPRTRKHGSLSPIVLENLNDDEDDKHRLYKTEMCRSWEEHGYCRYGSKCQFAHGWEELKVVVRHNKYKSELCRFFHVDGMCMYGSRCCFIHNINKEDKVKVTSENIYNLKMSRKSRLRVFEEISTGKDITEYSSSHTSEAALEAIHSTPESEPSSSRAVCGKSVVESMSQLRIFNNNNNNNNTDLSTENIAGNGRAMSPFAEARVAFGDNNGQLFVESPQDECWLTPFDISLQSHFGNVNLDAIDA